MIKDLLLEGFALKRCGHYKHAIEIFYKALELDNKSPELLLEIAELFDILGNEEKSLSYIEQVLNANPTHIRALKLLKKIFVDKKAYLEAEQTAKNIYCISKKEEDLADVFQLLNKQRKYDEIFSYNVDCDTPAILFEEAYAYFHQQNFEEAEKFLHKILIQDEDNQQALLLLGQTYFAQNREEECFKVVDKLKVAENNIELLDFIARAEMCRKNYAKAVRLLKQAIRVEHKNAALYFNLANIYCSQGDLAMAKKNFSTAIALKPDCEEYHLAVARVYYSEGNYKKALEELDGVSFDTRFLRAVILYNTGYVALAAKELEQLKAEQPENESVKEYLEKIRQGLLAN